MIYKGWIEVMNDVIDSKEVSFFIVKNVVVKIYKYYVDFMCWFSIFFLEGGEGLKNNCVCCGGGWVKSFVLVKLLSEVNFNLLGRFDFFFFVLDLCMIFKIIGIIKCFMKVWL